MASPFPLKFCQNFREKSLLVGGARGRSYHDPLIIDSDVGKDCGISSCMSTNSSSNESSLLISGHGAQNGHQIMIHGEQQDDKRLRRQIANSNERRRMQSINQGFQSLRHLLPNRQDGDKMSKVGIPM